MIKTSKKIFLLVIVLLFAMSALCYAQDTGTQKKKKYRTIAIGFDPLQFALGAVLLTPPVTILSGNVEFVVMKNFSLLADFTYVYVSNIKGFQAGGGARYYIDGQGLMNLWAGGYFDYLYVENISGFEGAVLVGYKKVIGPLFFDPFFGVRFASIPDVSILRFGLYIGLTF